MSTTTAGIIAEFNPFHNGHSTHISETRQITGCKHVIAVMSGNFVQRGEPAICNKWQRTRMALLNGVDVVIEIPVQYVISGADYFARGSVGLLNAAGVIDALCFGSESGSLQEIIAAGHVLAEEPALYKQVLRDKLDKGASFAAAKGAALGACLGEVDEGLLTRPNNGLAMEYCKTLRLLNSPMGVFTTHRQQGGPSATKIRQSLLAGQDIGECVPQNVKNILQNIPKFAQLDDFSDIFRYLLYTKTDAVNSLAEGLGNRFRRLCSDFSTISGLLGAVKTKRYTYTRLQRDVLKIILDILPQDMDTFDRHGGVQYIRVLGFRKEAAGIVGEMSRNASLPVITNGAAMDELLQTDGLGAKMLSQELMAGDIYRLISGESGGYCSERGAGIIIV
ncbi:MAG: nucleotidyltransferase family protein [Firmicutes bacterium]|nr:nucleotidyltransferase family protein [Bacillota bacterium]